MSHSPPILGSPLGADRPLSWGSCPTGPRLDAAPEGGPCKGPPSCFSSLGWDSNPRRDTARCRSPVQGGCIRPLCYPGTGPVWHVGGTPTGTLRVSAFCRHHRGKVLATRTGGEEGTPGGRRGRERSGSGPRSRDECSRARRCSGPAEGAGATRRPHDGAGPSASDAGLRQLSPRTRAVPVAAGSSRRSEPSVRWGSCPSGQASPVT
jgi:hypothetical protein